MNQLSPFCWDKLIVYVLAFMNQKSQIWIRLCTILHRVLCFWLLWWFKEVFYSTASKAGSECGSVEVLHNNKFEDGVIKLADIVDQFISATDINEDQKLPTSASSATTTTSPASFMTRTSSTPALNQLRQHMMTESVNHFMNLVDDCVEDSSIVGINVAADSKIDLWDNLMTVMGDFLHCYGFFIHVRCFLNKSLSQKKIVFSDDEKLGKKSQSWNLDLRNSSVDKLNDSLSLYLCIFYIVLV